jgi:hypothetical protein
MPPKRKWREVDEKERKIEKVAHEYPKLFAQVASNFSEKQELFRKVVDEENW